MNKTSSATEYTQERLFIQMWCVCSTHSSNSHTQWFEPHVRPLQVFTDTIKLLNSCYCTAPDTTTTAATATTVYDWLLLPCFCYYCYYVLLTTTTVPLLLLIHFMGCPMMHGWPIGLSKPKYLFFLFFFLICSVQTVRTPVQSQFKIWFRRNLFQWISHWHFFDTL